MRSGTEQGKKAQFQSGNRSALKGQKHDDPRAFITQLAGHPKASQEAESRKSGKIEKSEKLGNQGSRKLVSL